MNEPIGGSGDRIGSDRVGCECKCGERWPRTRHIGLVLPADWLAS